jgi:glycosyltransferase involved in cell wall biosynthesis
MPEFDREAGSGRIYDFIHFLREEGWHVTFASRRVIGRPDRYVRLLEQVGVMTLPAHGDDISELVSRERFDLAVLAFWEMGELYGPTIRALSPRTKVIVDSVDVHFVRNLRQAFMQPAGNSRPGLLDPSSGSLVIRELNAYAAADVTLTVSEKETDLLNMLLGDQANAATIPLCEDIPLSVRPFGARRGLLFVGNFRHAPNVDAVRYLCQDIVPRLPAAVLNAHPLYIVGNDATHKVQQIVAGVPPGVRLVGWVPSLIPYLEQVRAAVVPLRFGAGTKRKVIQSLMAGTPTVSSSIGTEGLGLRHGQDILVADDPGRFATRIVRLLEDEALWGRLRDSGRERVIATHGREVARKKFTALVRTAMSGSQNRPRLPDGRGDERQGTSQYGSLAERIRRVVDATVPPNACVLVVSKGDDALLQLGDRHGWHFPQAANGVYAGYHPKDSEAAIAHLEALRAKGAEYLLLPSTAGWWLEHYEGFRRHLEEQGRLISEEADSCRIFALGAASIKAPSTDDLSHVKSPTQVVASSPSPQSPPIDLGDLESLRPQIVKLPRKVPRDGRRKMGQVLVIGVYLANRPNTIEDIVARLSESRRFLVHQRWLALGGKPPSPAVEAVTIGRIDTPTPKFQLVNRVLASEDLSRYDYVLLVDDDVVFPRAFVDHFIPLQAHFDFALAQPARTSRSFIDHPIVEQQRGSVARQTLFVEIGPVVSFHRSIFKLVFPFDLTSSMGWGYENVWSARLKRRNRPMGIIDAVPVDHSVRPPVLHYRWEDADRERSEFLRKYSAPALEDCLRVLHVFTASEMSNGKSRPPVN